MVRTCGTTAKHSRRMLKKARFLTHPTLARRDAPCPKQGRSSTADPRVTFYASRFTAPGSEARTPLEAFFSILLLLVLAGCVPSPSSVEAIRKDSLNEMWNGIIIWSVNTRPDSRTETPSTTRALPSLSAEAPKAPPTTPAPYMDSPRLMPCAIRV